MTRRAFVALLCILALAPEARAADWFALEVGTERRYVDPRNGDIIVSRTTAIEMVESREVYRIENEVSGERDQLFWNYWSVDGEGQLLLHGFKLGPEPDADGRHYEPPIVWASGSPTNGATWSTTFEIWDRNTGATGLFLTVTGESHGVQVLNLAVGNFEALLTANTSDEGLPLRLGEGGHTKRYSLLGRRNAEDAMRVVEADDISWWVEGIGEVQTARFTSDGVVGTITFSSVPIEEGLSSASRLKSSFLEKR